MPASKGRVTSANPEKVDAAKQTFVWLDRIIKEQKASKEWSHKWGAFAELASQPRAAKEIQQQSLWSPSSTMIIREAGLDRPFPTTTHIVGMSSRPPPIKPPQERYASPITQNMEIGWIHPASRTVLSLDQRLF
ncbi:hypothetical protein SeMB42_g07565 [Synchytrium endobioticum]|uniref:Uncharacterized protein n=1 Tax=Synchytrium endobioticum TaxID=286115 RepID=A0A507D4A4_9FUNG|nr:hypothetical protein SeMB42_g07565 [Synchytrium endobioticum]TPX46125.1 hypothetical protein SeLEV6574_g03402 [Synchytrium endobioticum]